MASTNVSHVKARRRVATRHACLVVLVLCSTILLTPCPSRSALAAPPAVKWHPGHYVLVGNGRIRPEHVDEHFRGVQKRYMWSDLETAEGRYDFAEILSDLAFLQSNGKQLVIQLQYKAFGKGRRYVPAYVRGPEYGGGVYQTKTGSFDPVLWNVRVGERMDALFAALGRALDTHPGLEAVVLPETSPSASLDKQPQPGVEPYTVPVYVAALKKRMAAVRRAFPNTVVIQYTNFPQQALPELTAYMQEIGVGLGGPDVYPRPSGLSHPERGVYRFYAPLSGTVPLGAAVQSPDYSVAFWKRTAAFNRGEDRKSVDVTPEEEQPIPVREHLHLAQDTLKLNYIFWSAYPQECLENVKRMLAAPDLADDLAGGLDAKCPAKAFLARFSVSCGGCFGFQSRCRSGWTPSSIRKHCGSRSSSLTLPALQPDKCNKRSDQCGDGSQCSDEADHRSSRR